MQLKTLNSNRTTLDAHSRYVRFERVESGGDYDFGMTSVMASLARA